MKAMGERRRWMVGRDARALALALLVGIAPAVSADDAEDHDRARQALEAGEILPLKNVLEAVAVDTPGRVLEVELDRRHDRWVYEIKLLRQGGAVVKLWVDAKDGTVIDRRNRAGHHDR